MFVSLPYAKRAANLRLQRRIGILSKGAARDSFGGHTAAQRDRYLDAAQADQSENDAQAL
jgi:hypothetical protein